MKKLQDFNKEINKCAKCGLCQAVCPIYQQTGNECAVSKGKFVMLSGVLKKELKLNQKINSYLDLCTKCGKCSTFCPAGINVCEILQTAKYEYQKNKLSFKIIKIFQNANIFDKAIKLAQNLTQFFRTPSAPTAEILYFKGCANQIYPKTENALKKILQKANIKITEKDFCCCGLPFFSAGNLERFEQVKKHNTEIINKSNSKLILTDCASCQHTLKNYNTLKKTVKNIETLLISQNFHFKFKRPQTIAYHNPCHSENINDINKILSNCENINIVQLSDSCCGLAGEFALKHPQLSNKLAKVRAQEIIKSGANIIITTCPACIIGLKKALYSQRKFNIKVLHLTDFLASADEITV